MFCTKLSFRGLESCPAAGMKGRGAIHLLPSPLAAFLKCSSAALEEWEISRLTSQASLETCKRWRFFIHWSFPTQKKVIMVGHKNTALSKQKNSD